MATPLKVLTMTVLVASGFAQAPGGRSESKLVLTSSDARLVEGFNWAKQQALAYVFEGDPVGPWYEAALPNREAFCMRDTSHQANGAHALGLTRHNANMLRRFAENISASKDWCSYWEIDRHNRPAPADYQSDADFWYNLPANFDILDCCYRMYLWTGDSAYLNDPVFLNFYDRTVDDYVRRWDLSLDRIMKRTRAMNQQKQGDSKRRFQGARGIPGYDEGDEGYRVGIDLLGAQYAAYSAYAHIQDLRGDHARARVFQKKAEEVRAMVNTTWWNPKGQGFYSHINAKGKLQGRAGLDVLYRGIPEVGPRVQGGLDELLAAIRKEPSLQLVELQSHQAEVLYRYGKPDAAYTQMMDLTRENRNRREYPEVSFSVVGATMTGLMGIEVVPAMSLTDHQATDKVDMAVRTLSGLGQVAWAELRHLTIRANELGVRHEGGSKSTLINQSGPTLTWEAAFEGSHATLWLNGQPKKAHLQHLPTGRVTSSIRVSVGAGESAIVATNP
jgi:hypothetical protein